MKTTTHWLIGALMLAIGASMGLPANVPGVFPGSSALLKKTIHAGLNDKGFWEAEFRDGLVLVYIPAGEFWMGLDRKSYNESPRHRVTMPGYWLGKTEVTFLQFDEFCRRTGRRPPSDQGWGRGERPVINVSRRDAADYCDWLARETGLPFRLPSEAEWEKGARGDRETAFCWGNAPPTPDRANYWETGRKRTIPVGSLPKGASPFGLLDMSGNVWEWCRDRYGKFYYRESPASDPPGPASGPQGVLRGGGCYTLRIHLRSTIRRNYSPLLAHHTIGFRLCLRE
jgi:formylglycine-generating enzyme required for sulfatase activity